MSPPESLVGTTGATHALFTGVHHSPPTDAGHSKSGRVMVPD